MTVLGTTVKQPFNCNGSLHEFDFSFALDSADDLRIQVRDTDGNVVELVPTTQFEVSTEGVDYSSGGMITTVSYASGSRQVYAWPDGYVLTAYRETPLTQGSTYKNNRVLDQDVLEDDFDRVIMALQESNERQDRSMAVSRDDDVVDLELPKCDERANKYLAFDADGKPMVSPGGISSELPVSSFMESVIQAATAAAARILLGAKSDLDSLKSITDTYTALITDEILLCSKAAGFTLTLPTAAGYAGKRFIIVNTGSSGTITMAGNGSETIGGAANLALANQYEGVVIVSDGSNWQIASTIFKWLKGIVADRIADATLTLNKFAASCSDPVAGTAGLRTLGTGTQQALPGNTDLAPPDGSISTAKIAAYAITPVKLGVLVGDSLISANATERNSESLSYVKLKETRAGNYGALRIKFSMYTGNVTYCVYGQIYRNGSPVGTERSTYSGTYITYSEDISGWSPGDLCQIYGKTDNAVAPVYIKDLNIYSDGCPPMDYVANGSY